MDIAIELWELSDDCEIHNNDINSDISLVRGHRGVGTWAAHVHHNHIVNDRPFRTDIGMEAALSDVLIEYNYFANWVGGIAVAPYVVRQADTSVVIYNNVFDRVGENEGIISSDGYPTKFFIFYITSHNADVANDIDKMIIANNTVYSDEKGHYLIAQRMNIDEFIVANNIFHCDEQQQLAQTSSNVTRGSIQFLNNHLSNVIHVESLVNPKATFENNIENGIVSNELNLNGSKIFPFFGWKPGSSLINAGVDLSAHMEYSGPFSIGAEAFEVPEHTSTTLEPTAFDTWVSGYALNGKNYYSDDADGDGLENAVEFAINSDPSNPNDQGSFEFYEVEQGVAVTFATRRSQAAFTASPIPSASIDGVTYTVDASTDLQNWNLPVNEIAPIMTGLPSLASTDYEWRTFQVDLPSGTEAYLRLSLTGFPGALFNTLSFNDVNRFNTALTSVFYTGFEQEINGDNASQITESGFYRYSGQQSKLIARTVNNEHVLRMDAAVSTVGIRLGSSGTDINRTLPMGDIIVLRTTVYSPTGNGIYMFLTDEAGNNFSGFDINFSGNLCTLPGSPSLEFPYPVYLSGQREIEFVLDYRTAGVLKTEARMDGILLGSYETFTFATPPASFGLDIQFRNNVGGDLASIEILIAD